MQVFMVFKSFIIALIVYAWHARSTLTATPCILTLLLDSARWCVLRWAGLDMISALSPQISDQSWTGVASAVLTQGHYRTLLKIHSSRKACSHAHYSSLCRFWLTALIVGLRLS